jgi:hypothetical protein
MFPTQNRSTRIFLITLVSVFACVVHAAAPSRDEAGTVAANWLRLITERDGNWGGASNPSLGEVKEFQIDDITLGYVVAVRPQGYIVVSVSTNYSPIKAYSTTSNLDPADEHGMSALLRDVLRRRRQLLIDKFGSVESGEQQLSRARALDANRAAWSALLTGGGLLRTNLHTIAPNASGSVGPLLRTTWHQGSPYSGRDPSGSGCSHTVVGCVATAMAQIMRYYCWPPHGSGSHSYDWDGDNSCGGSSSSGANLNADFSNDYDWVNMPDSDATTTAQRAAVSELSYEAAVAVEMDFGCCSSGAYMYDPIHNDAQYAFEHYFYYDTPGNKPALEKRTDYAYDEWWSLIKNDIDHNRPMMYNILNSSGDFNHIVVIDGYDNSGGQYQVHANYGWNDAHTAWYTLDLFDCNNAAGWQGGCDADQESLLRFIYPTNGHIGSTSGVLSSGVYSYIYGDVTSSQLSTQAGAWVQFLGGTAGTKVTCSADSICFYGSAGDATHLFSHGDSQRGVKLTGGHMTLRQNGSINVH